MTLFIENLVQRWREWRVRHQERYLPASWRRAWLRVQVAEPWEE